MSAEWSKSMSANTTSDFGSDNWNTSTIRRYLNEDFYKQSFLKEERDHIEYRFLASRIVGATYLDSYAFSYDKIYILSADEHLCLPTMSTAQQRREAIRQPSSSGMKMEESSKQALIIH